MKKLFFILFIFFASCNKKNDIKTDSSQIESKDSLTFNDQLQNLKFKARINLVPQTARVNDLISLISNDHITIETRKKSYSQLEKINDIFKGYFKNNAFDIQGLKIASVNYIQSLEQVEYAKEFRKFEDSINQVKEKAKIKVEEAEYDLQRQKNK